MGLQLNVQKCELISANSSHPNATSLKDFAQMKPTNSCLLGAPVLPCNAMDNALAAKCELDRAISRLKLLHVHDDLLLLRACFSAKKNHAHSSLLALLTWLHIATTVLPLSLLRPVITNTGLTDIQRILASLPVGAGGLGFAVLLRLHLLPFWVLLLAHATSNLSCHSTVILHQILMSTCQSCYGPHLIAYIAWLYVCHQTTSSQLIRLLCGQVSRTATRARLLAVSSTHSGDWLHALPMASYGTRLDNKTIRVAVGLRLGVNLCELHVSLWHIGGNQGLSRSILQTQSRVINLSPLSQWPGEPKREPSSSRSKSLLALPIHMESEGWDHPSGLSLIPWQRGKRLTWDVRVADILAATYLASLSMTAGSVSKELLQGRTTNTLQLRSPALSSHWP